jgi:hypothetical protein
MRVAGLVGMAALAVNLHAANRALAFNRPCATPDVTVYVVSASVLDVQTKALAVRMLAVAGVQVRWDVGEPKPDAVSGLAVGIRLGEASAQDQQRGVLAWAHPFGGGLHRITIFQDRVHDIAGTAGVEVFKVMAHVLVHEIGHVLERTDHHSDTGVMKAHWTRTDFQAMAWRPLPFEEEDMASIHGTLEGLRQQCRIVAEK